MAKALDFNKLDQLAKEEGRELERSRWKSRDVNPTVQMSIRQEEADYLRFRALCKAERRTNGEMLKHMMEFYVSGGETHPKTPPDT